MSNVISLVGPPKMGKTDWALTASELGNLKHEEFDLGGFDRAAWRYTKPIKEGLITTQVFQVEGAEDEVDKHVALTMLKNYISHDMSADSKVTKADHVGWKELWYSFLDQYVKDVTSGEYKTIIIDSATNLWPICHKALLQEKQEAARRVSGGTKTRESLSQIEYGEANDRFLPIIQAAREMDVNLIVVHHTTEERQSMMIDGRLENVETGKYIPQGWRHTRKWIDLEIWFEMKEFFAREINIELLGTVEGNVKVPSTQATIEVSGMHRNAVGMKFFDSKYADIINTMRMLRGEEPIAT